jgi:hypothetical protein
MTGTLTFFLLNIIYEHGLGFGDPFGFCLLGLFGPRSRQLSIGILI